MGLEYEWKFRATEESQAEILAAIPGQAHHIAMQTTYYDTPAGQLSDLHCTLRTRLENGTCVCTLKTPAGGSGRHEWEIACPQLNDAAAYFCSQPIPAELPELLKGELVAICGAKFDRVTKTVAFEDCVLELAIDKGILLGGGRSIPLCEVEVELKSGSRKSCDMYAIALAQKFDLQQERKSKFRRALELKQQGDEHRQPHCLNKGE